MIVVEVVVVVIVAVVVVVVVLMVVVVVVVSSGAVLVEKVVVLLFCRNSTFEVVDCMRAGLEKKAGSRGGAAPPAGGAEPSPICKHTLFSSPSKSFEKKVVQY